MTEPSPPSSPEFLEIFRRQADADGVMSFARFMELALYDPAVGYYTQRRSRIGRRPSADFTTAAALGPLFGELVAAACATLLGPRVPGDHTFVEIGAEPAAAAGGAPEPARSVLAGVAHPFAAATAIPLGQALTIPPRAVVFSNELFDAQPFNRVMGRGGAWRECAVALRHGQLEEILLPELTSEVRAIRDRLPVPAPDGYHIDLPLAAAQLAGRIADRRWTGLFVAFDYGKSWRELAADTPAGTARAYHRHQQSNDLLARPGEQDLTGHVCWDWLAAELSARGFAEPVLESQEAFLVHHAATALRAVTTAEAGQLSFWKLGVLQLLHPGNMGQKFQVLWAMRDRAG